MTFPRILYFVVVLWVTGCGTRTGNSFTSSDTLISSTAFSTSSLSTRNSFRSVTDATVTDLEFCVRKVRLEDENATPVSNENGETEITFSPGLIQVSDGSAAEWGTASLPAGFTLSKLKIKMQKDESACGVSYAFKFNGVTTEEEVELEWRFDPPLSFQDTTQEIQLNLQSFVDALLAAADGSTLTEETLKTILEAVEESAEEGD